MLYHERQLALAQASVEAAMLFNVLVIGGLAVLLFWTVIRYMPRREKASIAKGEENGKQEL